MKRFDVEEASLWLPTLEAGETISLCGKVYTCLICVQAKCFFSTLNHNGKSCGLEVCFPIYCKLSTVFNASFCGITEDQIERRELVYLIPKHDDLIRIYECFFVRLDDDDPADSESRWGLFYVPATDDDAVEKLTEQTLN